MKGIILAGGLGTRLYPLTKVLSKQILPIYDKPMIYYPLSTLMMANINEILIISTPRDIQCYQTLLGNGSDLGIDLTYKVQETPKGIADAFLIGEDFIGRSSVALILGDNIFYGNTLNKTLDEIDNTLNGGLIFGYFVDNPSDYGVIEFDDDNNIISLEEKPLIPKSNYAIPGLYFYDNQVIDIAKNITPSARGELEITAINEAYKSLNQLQLKVFDQDTIWFDTGTFKGLMDATFFIYNTQKSTNKSIGCIEETAFNKGYISIDQLILLANSLSHSEYGKYLNKLSEGENL